MSIKLLGRWNSELTAQTQQSTNSRNNPIEIKLQNALCGGAIKDVCLGVYHMIILTDKDDIFLAGTSLPIDDKKNLQLIQVDTNLDSTYFPIYKFTSSLTSSQAFFQSPHIACGPEFGIFTQSVKEGINHRHFLNLFGWDSKKVFDSRRNTTRNSLSDILQGLLLDKVLTEEIPSHDDGEFISQIVCGGDFWLTVLNKRKVFGKGYNRDGVLGLGHKKDCKKITALPVQDMLLHEKDKIEKVCCGLHHAIFVISNAHSATQIFASGDNRFGQIAQSSSVHTIKFQSKFSKSDSLTNLVQSNGFRDINCEYQSTWLLTTNNRLFACGFLANPNLDQSFVQKVFVPIEFRVPHSSSLFSNCISQKAPFHFGCGGFHSVFGNHRSDSIVGIGANTCEQLFPKVIPTTQNDARSMEEEPKYVNKLNTITESNCIEKRIVKKIVCSRDCSMILMEPLPPIKGLGDYLITSKLSDITILVFS